MTSTDTDADADRLRIHKISKHVLLSEYVQYVQLSPTHLSSLNIGEVFCSWTSNSYSANHLNNSTIV